MIDEVTDTPTIQLEPSWKQHVGEYLLQPQMRELSAFLRQRKASGAAVFGQIELLPNPGARVRQLSQRDLEELFDVMAGLESLAGRLACEAITDEEIAAIERLHYEMYGHYLHRDMHGYFQTNQQIHESIVAAARNATLKTTYANFAGRIRRVRYSANFARKRQRWAEAMREHEAILDALRRRAGSELSDILFQHLRNKRGAAIEHLAEGHDSAPGEAPQGS